MFMTLIFIIKIPRIIVRDLLTLVVGILIAGI